MDIKPIEIEIEDIKDKKLYTQIVFLVDRSEFLKEIAAIRKKYLIGSQFQQKDYFETASDESLSSLMEFKAQLLPEISRLRTKYKYPPYFDDVIFQVIMFNKVRTIKSTHVVMHLANISSTQNLSDQSMEMAILLTPLSTKQEVMSAFDEAKKLREEYEKKHQLSQVLQKDTLTNIVRDRKWYWRVQEDGNYKNLLKEWNERPDVHEFEDFHKGGQRCDLCYINDDNYVHQAVHEYRKQLK